MKKIMIALPLAAALAACGSNGGGTADGGVRQQLKVVGSSTVYPFTTAIAEQFQRDNPNVSVVVESTGTGAGMKLFCGGVGANFPDIENASRQIKKSEYEACAAAGVKNVIEVPVGIDGLTFIEGTDGQLAESHPGGHLQCACRQSVREGPEQGADLEGRQSGASRDQDQGARSAADVRHARQPCRALSRKGLQHRPGDGSAQEVGREKHKDVCTKVREDGLLVEAGENDNLLVQKVNAEPGTLGVLGYSYLEENSDKVKPVQVAGVVSDRGDHRRPVLSGRPQALHLSEGRASCRQARSPATS